MDKFLIKGGKKIKGEIKVSGAKNVAMKVMLAGLLTDKDITLNNIPLISSVLTTTEIVKLFGVKVTWNGKHSLTLNGSNLKETTIPLDLGGVSRAASMVIGPLLNRFGRAVVPNPGGCRIGKRSIERHIDGLRAMGAEIKYDSGYFYAKADKLRGIKFRFSSNTHTGTETLILAAVKAEGETVLENAAEEPEIDDLIGLLNKMGGKIKRINRRSIIIQGVNVLNGVEYSIMPDRNEVVTFAIGALASSGDITIEGAQGKFLHSFLEKVKQAKGNYEIISDNKIRFYRKRELQHVDVLTKPYPEFMTDWQAPWALLMTQAKGSSVIHETVYEDRFGYVSELRKMGADVRLFNPDVKNPERFYNFNWSDRNENSFHAVRIKGITSLHDAVLEVTDLRAGATLVLGACIAEGESVVRGIDHIDRGYEALEERLTKLNVSIKRIKEK